MEYPRFQENTSRNSSQASSLGRCNSMLCNNFARLPGRIERRLNGCTAHLPRVISSFGDGARVVWPLAT